MMKRKFGLLWSFAQQLGLGALTTILFGLFVISSTVLFGSVFWSKFAHMFFKPAAAYQKKVTQADGTRENLPADYDLNDPAVQAKFPDAQITLFMARGWKDLVTGSGNP